MDMLKDSCKKSLDSLAKLNSTPLWNLILQKSTLQRWNLILPIFPL